jgi:FkbM family methyltransferase
MSAQAPLGVRARLKAAYHRLLTLPTGGRGLRRRTPGGEELVVLPDFRYVSWTQAEYSQYRAELRAGDVVFDVGANAGGYSLLFGQWVGRQGRVYAFEPAPVAFGGLTRHVTLNGLAEVVIPVALALSDQPGEVSFVADGFQGTNRLAAGSEATGAANALRVTCDTVDRFCAARGVQPRVLKIDTEGAELLVLRGARETLQRAGEALVLFIELHPSRWAGFGYRREDLVAELDRQELAVHPASGPADAWTRDTGLPVRIVRRARA